MPVNLLLQGRPCLVVGGGTVGLRKTRALLKAGGDVTVVAPELHEDLRALAEQGRIHHVARIFRQADVEGMFLAFAATDDRAANLRVLECCRAGGVLCCPVDRNWPKGDFLTPATFRQDGLVISVSTGGASCRRSRMVKDNLAKHVDLVSTSDLLVVGTDHSRLSLARREPLHLTEQRFREVGGMLAQVWGVHEFVLLNTCNRVEMIAAVADDPALEALVRRIVGVDRLEEGEYYALHGYDAFQHVAVVAAGMLSQSPGEDHVVAQIKEALDRCQQEGWAGGIMRGWVGDALHLSKDIRSETAALLKSGEIEDTCMEYLDATSPNGGHALVLGSGVMGEGIVHRLLRRGYDCDWLYHTSKPAPTRGREHRVSVRQLADMGEVLSRADVVVMALTTSEPVLTVEHAQFLDSQRGTLVFDLGIPRNVAPELEEAAPGAKIIDLDTLKAFHARHLADLDAALARAREVVAEHRGMYDQIVRSLQGRHARQ